MSHSYIDDHSDRRTGPKQNRGGLVFIVVALFLLLLCSRYIASTLIDYSWWTELGQTDTWLSLYLYTTGPLVLAFLLLLVVFWTAFRFGMHHWTGDLPFGFVRRTVISRVALLALGVLALLVANATVRSWSVVRYFGGLRLTAPAGEFVDPIFGKNLHFYFFSLPFYNTLLRVVLVGAVLSLIIYGLTSNAENLSKGLPTRGSPSTFEFERISFSNLFDSSFVRLAAAAFLLGLAVHYYLARYDMLLEDHGT